MKKLKENIKQALTDKQNNYFFHKLKNEIISLPKIETLDDDFQRCTRVEMDRTKQEYIQIHPLQTEDWLDVYYTYAQDIADNQLLDQLDEMLVEPNSLVQNHIAKYNNHKVWNKLNDTFLENVSLNIISELN